MSFYRGYAAFLFLVAACIQSLFTANGKQYYTIWLKHETGDHKGQYTRLAVEHGKTCFLKDSRKTSSAQWGCVSEEDVWWKRGGPRIQIVDSAVDSAELTPLGFPDMTSGETLMSDKGSTLVTVQNHDAMSKSERIVYVEQGDHKVSIHLDRRAAWCPETYDEITIQVKGSNGKDRTAIHVPSKPTVNIPVFEIKTDGNDENDEKNWSIEKLDTDIEERDTDTFYPNKVCRERTGLAILSTGAFKKPLRVAALEHPPTAETVAILIPDERFQSCWTFPLKFPSNGDGMTGYLRAQRISEGSPPKESPRRSGSETRSRRFGSKSTSKKADSVGRPRQHVSMTKLYHV